MRLFHEDMMGLQSVYCTECCEERWLTTSRRNSFEWDGREVCRRCYQDLKDGIIPLFSHRNNMVSVNIRWVIRMVVSHLV